ncbi:hypothetical protein Pfo_007784 [Paulownia fortunei]|nr:hypothetical protein Pfo_007784 [Paulownia fortunei]
MDTRIENLELQIKKSGLELQILEADLRDYELDPEQESSLHQLSWCERNINHSLERVIARKSTLFSNLSTSYTQPNFQMDRMELENQDGIPFSSHFNENELTLTTQNPTTGQILMQLDPWISPYSARVRDNIFQDLFDQTKCTPNMNPGPSNISNLPISSNKYNFSIPHSSMILNSGIVVTSYAQIPPSQIPQQQPFVVDQALLNFPGQNNVNAWNNFSSATFSNAIHNSTPSLCTTQPPRFTSTTIVTTNAPQYDKMETSLQYGTLNFSQFTNIEGEEIGQVNMDYGNNMSNDNADEEDSYRVSCNKIHTSDQSEVPYQVHPQKEVSQDTPFDNPQQEDTFGDNTLWASKIQKSNLWEWEDLLLDENFNLGNFSK